MIRSARSNIACGIYPQLLCGLEIDVSSEPVGSSTGLFARGFWPLAMRSM